MNTMLDKCSKLKTVNNNAIADEMLKRLTENPHTGLWVREPDTIGDVALFHDDRYKGMFIEVVVGLGADVSCVTTLFEDNGLLRGAEELKAMRKELMTEIGVLTRSLPSAVAIHDEGRGRDVHLREMGTAQLYDILIQAKGLAK